MRFHRILAAINDSQLCPYIFETALELAKSNNATLLLLHCLLPEVMSETTSPTSMDLGMTFGIEDNDYQTQQILIDKQIDEVQAMLNRHSEVAMSQGVPTEVDYKVGEAGHELCEAAKNWQADLIIVGRRGRSGLTEALLGSVSNYVVHHAPCSVLVIQEVETEPLMEVASELSLEG